MIHTERIEKAIHTAAVLHRKQVRKGENELPYITHLFSVFTILAEYTDDEDTLIAGLLHDTLEDTDYTPEELKRDFGERVLATVEGVTEPKEGASGVKLSWTERKKGYIEVLKNAPEESVLVSAVDKIHNFSSVLGDYKDNPKSFADDFNMEDRIFFYEEVVKAIRQRLGTEHSLVERLEDVFGEYKKFLENVYN